jgi:GNAT superfamily N-acetyltransferase
MVAGSRTNVLIVPNQPDFAEELELLQRAVYNGSKEDHHPDALHAEHFRSQVAIFPEGQFVAIDPLTGRIVGHTSSMLLHYDPSQPFTQPWVVTTDYGRLTPHDPTGDWMYGVESAVLPEYQGCGVGSALYAARFAVAQRLNLRGILAGSTIMNYHEHVERMTPDEYVRAVEAGLLYDNNLTKQLRKGFRLLNVIPDYVSDELSCGYGAAIVWENPAYDPSQPSPMSTAA